MPWPPERENVVTKVLILILWLCLSLPTAAAPGPVQLIYYGWDNPKIVSLASVLPKLAKSPFDGMAVMATAHTELFTVVPFAEADFANDNQVLESLNVQQLASSYLLIHSAADQKFDWTSESHWAAVQQNLKYYSQLVKRGKFKGIVFDMEPYGKNPWSYSSQIANPRVNFTTLGELVRGRGADMMSMLQTENPGITIWTLYGLSANQEAYSALKAGKQRTEALEGDGYGLWPYFLSGWVGAADAKTKIIDGNEPSYYYSQRQDFFDARSHVENDLQILLPPETRKNYTQSIQLGQAVYVDGVMNAAKSPRFIGYYFESEADRIAMLKSNIQNAMQSSKSLVWIYSEVPKWWENAPVDLIDRAIREAKKDGLDQVAPPDRPATQNAARALAARVSIGGKITDQFGRGVKPSGFLPDLANRACSSWGDEGAYGCEFPKGVEIVVEPLVPRRIVKPRQIRRHHQNSADWNVNFTVQ